MIAKGENNAGMESLCYWANVTDTWTNDVRNNTLPTEKATSLTDTITLPPYLVPSKSMYSPDYCESSWAFAVTEMISDRLYRSSKGMTLRTFSVQALLNCGVGSC